MTHKVLEDDVRRAARRAAGRKLGFYVHAAAYVGVNLLLVVIAALTGRPAVAAFPLLGWCIGLAMHGLVALGPIERLHGLLLERELQARGRNR